MNWEPLGDTALIFFSHRATPADRLAESASLAQHLQSFQIPEILDIVSSFDSVALHFRPLHAGLVREWLTSALLDPPRQQPLPTSTHEIPTFYDHAELTKISALLNLSPNEIIQSHSTAHYTVAALGFSPGFPYLLGLPKKLTLTRLKTPRPITAGTVAFAAHHAGIYPNDSLGGWHPIGKTSFPLFNLANNPPTPLKPGDSLRFKPLSSPPQTPTPNLDPPPPTQSPVLQITNPGPGTTIQDPGRSGFQHYGVSRGGSADRDSAAAANLLVGNPPEAPILEFCLQGPVLTALRDTTFAVVGGPPEVSGTTRSLKMGQSLDLRPNPSAAFGYLAISGGFDVPKILGSHATDVRAGFGGHQGRPLQTGDLLGQLPPRPAPRLAPGQHITWPQSGLQPQTLLIRVLPGLQHDLFDDPSQFALLDEHFTKTSRLDRTGARLEGPKLSLASPHNLTSQPVTLGTIQVPPDGLPIVLQSECQTIGGYPVIAHIIAADLPLFTRALPGTQIRFHPVNLDQAAEAFTLRLQELAFLQSALKLSTP
ncbi:MAG: carboxyltransferase domain-containing protein [Verrucomicrobiota bacterium]